MKIKGIFELWMAYIQKASNNVTLLSVFCPLDKIPIIINEADYAAQWISIYSIYLVPQDWYFWQHCSLVCNESLNVWFTVYHVVLKLKLQSNPLQNGIKQNEEKKIGQMGLNGQTPAKLHLVCCSWWAWCMLQCKFLAYSVSKWIISKLLN